MSHKTPKQFPRDVTPTQNPFWNQLSGSNPFLDDIVHVSADEHQSNGSTTKPDEDAISTSSDEGNLGTFLENKHKASNQSGRWRSASDILDDLARKEPPRGQSFNPPQPVLNPDFEWLKDDREAYKMAWLSHRQLTRSCLDLSLMSQSPGWAQTQATDCQLICKLGSAGGLVQLPGSHICLNIPAGHVAPGEVQEVTLKATLDPPPGLNNNYMTTISPLLEVVLSHINTTECVCVKMKLSGEVRSDPVSQVMTSVVGLLSNKREGPYVKVTDCSVKKNTMEMKLQDLKTHFYVIAVAEASAIQSPATSVWDYLHRHITVAVYGPRYIHPSFKVVVVVCCQEDVPPKLPFSDIGRGNKHLPPLVLHLWGTHRFKSDKLHDLFVAVSIPDATFTVKGEDAMKEVRQSQLRIGAVLHLPVALLCADHTDVLPFKLHLQVQESGGAPAAQFQVASPPAAPIRSEKRVSRQLEKRVELARNSAIPKDGVMDFPKFTDAPVSVRWYAVALKSVLRQPRVEYLLEYFKGDTVALLSRDSVRSVGNSKVKEWYIGFLRGRTGLIHCRNFKVITREQVIDFTGIKITTQVLLDNMALPFNKLTYMYSAIQTLVTEHVSSWRRLADALGYKPSLDAISHRYAESEADEVACVLEKLKEDCHAENSGKKFLHELMVVSRTTGALTHTPTNVHSDL